MTKCLHFECTLNLDLDWGNQLQEIVEIVVVVGGVDQSTKVPNSENSGLFSSDGFPLNPKNKIRNSLE